MRVDAAAVVGPDGWITWEALTARVSRATVARWLSTGTLLRPHPGIYALPDAAARWRVRVESALRTRQAVASHGTALALWGLLPPPAGPVHLMVERWRSGRGSSDVVLHRTDELSDITRRAAGMRVTSVERAIVDTWGQPGPVSRPAVRGAAITAVRQRLCTPKNLAYELDRRPQLPGRAELAELVRLLAEGCQSELEIWGCLHILRGPGMPTFVLQRRIRVAGERFVLDAACEESLLAVEMDGAAHHGSREQRERDIRRDALVATIGWQTLRFGFRRMTTSPDACRRDILAAHAARLRLMGGGMVR